MESKSDMPGMQPETWTKYIKPLETPRKGQAKLYEITAKADISYGRTAILSAIFPTGYGKTKGGLGSYLILRGQGVSNRLLVFVPNDDLRRQWSEDARDEALKLGATISGAIQLNKPAVAFRHHLENTVEIYVATYQQGISNGGSWIDELLETGNWTIICDEFHHLVEDRAWGKVANKAIDAESCRVAYLLSATPIRTDQRPTIGGCFVREEGGWRFNPDVYISRREALEEQAIRKPKGNIQHYFVDVLPDGEDQPIRVTTEQLREEGFTDFSEYEAKRKLRYVGEYLHKILLDATSVYYARNMRHPRQHQILVFAMSCTHAEAITAQMNSVTHPGFADWIGIKRSYEENKSILKKYHDNELPCLIQIDKAGEGFNNKRASILVFLHLLKSGTKIIQQIGRGLRRNADIKEFDEDYCVIFASADTEVAAYIDGLEEELGIKEKDIVCGPPDDIDRWPLFPELMIVEAEFDKTELINYGEQDAEMETFLSMAREAGASEDLIEQMKADWFRKLARRLSGAGRPTNAPSEAFRDETAKEAYYHSAVNKITSGFANKAATLNARNNGEGFEKRWLGQAKTELNKQWKRAGNVGHGQMMSEEYKAKYYWVRQEYEQMRATRELPSWLKLR